MVRTYNPMGNIESYITKEQADNLIEIARVDWHKMVFLLLSRSGRRVTEVLMLKCNDIKWENSSIKWNILKKKKITTKVIPQDDHTLSVLKTFIINNKIGANDYVFKSYGKTGHYTRGRVNAILFSYGKKLNIDDIGGEKIHPHMFRHGFAIHFVKNMKRPDQLFQLQKIMQHADIRETMWYLDHFGQTEIREMMTMMWKD
jgi:integrase